MCGICGFNWEDKNLIRKMTQSLIHRGPDDSGFYIDKNISLGNRRLSIIDLKTGKQPIHNEDNNIWITFNGEIFNFRELRVKLEEKGHRFYTETDTEVIVHCYEEYGEQFLEHLNGEFAFALWDSKKKQIILARDRLGIRPLFYSYVGKKLAFSSELNSLLKGEINREIDFKAVYDFFSYNYIPAPKTIYKNIRKLEPGHFLKLASKGIEIKKYWGLKLDGANIDYSQILNGFKKSVEERMIADVPVGFFLSGGIDSSLITAMASENHPGIQTFSIGFDDKNYDELKYARIIADKFKTEHYEKVVDSSSFNIFPKLIAHFGEPFADSSAIPTYFVAQLARKNGIKVVLSGEGGDELFGGYYTYQAHKFYSLYRKFPHFLRDNFKLLANRMHEKDRYSLKSRIKRFVNNSETNVLKRHYSWRTVFQENELNNLINKKIDYLPFSDYDEQVDSGDDAKIGMYKDVKHYLPGDLLVKSDIMSMANSVETRPPFLEHNFVQSIVSLPSSEKIKYFQKKYLLKKIIGTRLPKEILNRKKMGFCIPGDSWLRDSLKDEVKDILSDKNMNKISFLNKSYIYNLISRQLKRKEGNSQKIFGLLSFVLWHKMFIQRVKPEKLV